MLPMKPIHFTLLWRQCDWGLYGRRNEVFARALAAHPSVGHVVHVEPVSPKQLLQHARSWWAASQPALAHAHGVQLRKMLPPTRHIHVAEDLAITSLGVATKRAYPEAVAAVNRTLVRTQARRIERARRNGSSGAHCVVAYPPAAYLPVALDALTYDLCVADLIDDVPAQVANDRLRRAYRQTYADVLPRCDWAVATSEHVAATFQPYATCPIDVLRNGVHVDETATSSSVASSKGHGVGYVGMINQTMNVALVDHVTRALPNVTFKLAGPVHPSMRDRIAPLRKRSNVIFRGPILKSDVPAFLRECRVLFSFKRNDAITAGNDSMKIYEYLATGRPVVSTPVAPADRFDDVVYTAETPQAFEAALKTALVENDPARVDRRLELARNNAWTQRIDAFVQGVASRLQRIATDCVRQNE